MCRVHLDLVDGLVEEPHPEGKRLVILVLFTVKFCLDVLSSMSC